MFPFGSGLFQKSFEGSLCSLLDGLENSSAENDKKYSQKVLPFLAEKFLNLARKSKVFCPVDFLFSGNVFAPMGEAVDFSQVGLSVGQPLECREYAELLLFLHEIYYNVQLR